MFSFERKTYKFRFLEVLLDIIASIKLAVIQQSESNVKQSLEATLDRLIELKHSKLLKIDDKKQQQELFYLLAQRVAGNSDGFVESTVNEIENLYSQKTA